MADFEPLGGRVVFEGKTFSVHVERFRHDGGDEVEREIVRRQDAVAIVAHDGEQVWLVRQPREAIGAYALELPAGKLDVEGESPLECARRELGEEIGKRAERWEQVARYHSSSGYSDEVVHVFAATELSDGGDASAEEDERIEIVRRPLAELEATIAECADAKTIIGLRWLQVRRG